MKKQGLRASTPTAPSPSAALATENALRRVFESWAYVETRLNILQPLSSGSNDPNRTFTVTDETGGVLALRQDFTPLVAQEAALLGRGIVRPLRRSYCGTAFRNPRCGSNTKREIRQSGVELIGASGPMADAEIVTLASEGLAALKLTDAQINLGHVGFIDSLLQTSKLSSSEKLAACNLLSRHDRPALATLLFSQNVPPSVADALLQLLDLVGSSAVLAQARKLTSNPEAIQALDELETLAELLDQSDLPVPVVIDLTEVRDRSYYTGIRFEGFAPSSGYPILRGGRYDNLIQNFGSREPAVGCAFEIDRLASLVAQKELARGESIFLRFPSTQWSGMLAQARSLRAKGNCVALDILSFSSDELEAYCAAYQINPIAVPESVVRTAKKGGRQ